MKRGMLFATDSMPGGQLLKFAREVEETGLDCLWVPELFGREPFVTAGALLSATESIRVGTAIANVYVRDALATRAAATTLAELSGNRFSLGLGVSNSAGNTVRGHAWMPPVRKLEEFFDAMEQVPLGFEHPDPVPVYLAAHGPRLMAFAAARADGALTYLSTLGYNEQSRKTLGSGKQLIAMQICLVNAQEQEARERVRRAISVYVPLANYRRAWSAQGFSAEDFEQGGSDRLIDALVAWGSMDQVRERLELQRRAGVDQVVLIPLNASRSSGPDLGIMRELLAP